MAETESMLLYFNITYKKLIRNVGVLPSGTQTLLGYEDSQPEINVPVATPIDLFYDESRVLETFSLLFRWLGIDPDFHQHLVSLLIGEVKERIRSVSMVDNDVLPSDFPIILVEKDRYISISDDEPDCVEFMSSSEHGNQAGEGYDLEELGFTQIEPSQDFGSIENYEPNWLLDGEVESSFSDSDYEEEEEVASVTRQSSVEYEDENYGLLLKEEESRVMLEEVKVKEEETGKSCSVCLEELEEIASALPCAHIFHEKCIVRWLSMSHFCPLCRFEMSTEL